MPIRLPEGMMMGLSLALQGAQRRQRPVHADVHSLAQEAVGPRRKNAQGYPAATG